MNTTNYRNVDISNFDNIDDIRKRAKQVIAEMPRLQTSYQLGDVLNPSMVEIMQSVEEFQLLEDKFYKLGGTDFL